MPTMKTSLNSRPFAEWTVIRVTLLRSSSFSLSWSVSRATSWRYSPMEAPRSSSLAVMVNSWMAFSSSSTFWYLLRPSGELSLYKSLRIPVSVAMLRASS